MIVDADAAAYDDDETIPPMLFSCPHIAITKTGEVSFYRKCDVIELKAFTAWRELGFDLIAGNHENVILARADAWPTA